MKDYGTQRSTVQPNALVIDDYSAWVYTNIHPVNENVGEENEFNGYEFNMVQYEKDEYIKLIDDQNKANQVVLNNLLGVN
ncbi:MAG: hypothetical protein R3Y47_02210 [Lachnospiraceae bacterium]